MRWWFAVSLAVFLAACRKKTVTIEPYSLIEGAQPSGPVVVRANRNEPGSPWRPGSSIVVPFPNSGGGNVEPRLEGPVIAEEISYHPELDDLKQPVRVPFVPLSPSTRPLLESGLLVTTRAEKTLRLLVRERGLIKLVEVVEYKCVRKDETKKPLFLVCSLPDLSKAIQRLVDSHVIPVGPERMPAAFYYVRPDEEDFDPALELTAELNHEDFRRIAAVVLALQVSRRPDGAPVLDLGVQRMGKHRVALNGWVDQYDKR
jgi:hypothetical protein